jgi:gas vesicle protein
MTKQTKILTGLLAGAALGAGIALILSNDKNSELKEKVSDWFSDLIESSKDKFAGVTGLVKDTLVKAKA